MSFDYVDPDRGISAQAAFGVGPAYHASLQVVDGGGALPYGGCRFGRGYARCGLSAVAAGKAERHGPPGLVVADACYGFAHVVSAGLVYVVDAGSGRRIVGKGIVAQVR